MGVWQQLGHLAALLQLTQGFRAPGDDNVSALPELDGDLSLLPAAGFVYLHKPKAISLLQQMHKMSVRRYADVLARCIEPKLATALRAKALPSHACLTLSKAEVRCPQKLGRQVYGSKNRLGNWRE